tara:strand:- start:6783 stop:7325 length:543 start_codon:yes stop_codon:yes gene_type:complete
MVKIINFLTISRIIIGPIIFMILISNDNNYLAFILFMIAGLTDYADGYLARKYNATSQIGEILDPIADKILIVFMLFGLSITIQSYILAFSSCLIISREIWVTALRDLNSRNNNIEASKVTFLAKIKTAFQMFTISIYLIAISFQNMLLIIIGDILIIVSVLVTLYTGYEYTLNSLKKTK